MDDLGDLVRGWLVRELRMDVADVGEDTPLVSGGRLDSMALVRLAAFLERQLGLRIPDRDVAAKHFDTVARMRAYVDARRGR